jgi:hypothetical protein
VLEGEIEELTGFAVNILTQWGAGSTGFEEHLALHDWDHSQKRQKMIEGKGEHFEIGMRRK